MDKKITYLKTLISLFLVIGLCVMAIPAYKVLPNTVETVDNDTVLVYLFVLTFLWYGLSEVFKASGKTFSYISLVLTTIGEMAILILLMSYSYVSSSYTIMNSAFDASTKLASVLDVVKESAVSPVFLTIIMIIIMVIVVPNVSILYFLIFVAGFFAYKIDHSDLVILVKAMEIAIIIFGALSIVFEKYFSPIKDEDSSEFSFSNFIHVEKKDSVILGIALSVTAVTMIVGKMSSWTDYFKLIFSNDFKEMLELDGMTYNSIIVVSILVSFSISATISTIVEKAIEKHLSSSIFAKIATTLVNLLINVWILDYIISIFIGIFVGDIKRLSLFDSQSIPKWLYNLDVPDGLSFGAAFVVTAILVILCIVLLIVANVLYFAAWMMISKALVEGLVFLYVSFFINSFFALDYSGFSAIVTFLLLYIFNALASGFSSYLTNNSLLKPGNLVRLTK